MTEAAAINADERARRTVESVVREQLSKALGGPRGVVEGAVPTIAFTLGWMITHNLRLSVVAGVGIALILLAVRISQKSTVQFVLNSLIGIGIAAVFALRSGNAGDAFLPGILYNAGYAVAMTFSIIIRWPVVGFILGSVTGDPTAWRQDPAIVRLCSKLTWLMIVPCAVRVLVQYPLYLSDHIGWLGTSKIVLGWPLQVASFAAMLWVLTRGRTPLAETPQETADKLSHDDH
ncbi:DUF3159 domain-containing protein [Actinocorallia lasiicapitis]